MGMLLVVVFITVGQWLGWSRLIEAAGVEGIE